MKGRETENNISNQAPLTEEQDKVNFRSRDPDTALTDKSISARAPHKSLHAIIENEKCKLGQELHDGVNPLLTAALLYLKLIRPVSKHGKKVKETIQIILMEAIGCIRSIASDLVVIEQKQYELKDLLEKHLERLRTIIEFSITIDIDGTGMITRLTDIEKTSLYRIIQEQINNIIKYSKANNVKIQSKEEPHRLVICIRDDGVGFDTTLVKNGIGLLNMKSRMEDMHGTIQIESSPGNGCSIYLFLPVPAENSPCPLHSY